MLHTLAHLQPPSVDLNVRACTTVEGCGKVFPNKVAFGLCHCCHILLTTNDPGEHQEKEVSHTKFRS
jgi:hypothetical protein